MLAWMLCQQGLGPVVPHMRASSMQGLGQASVASPLRCPAPHARLQAYRRACKHLPPSIQACTQAWTHGVLGCWAWKHAVSRLRASSMRTAQQSPMLTSTSSMLTSTSSIARSMLLRPVLCLCLLPCQALEQTAARGGTAGGTCTRRGSACTRSRLRSHTCCRRGTGQGC
jgi:hypothetical protein